MDQLLLSLLVLAFVRRLFLFDQLALLLGKMKLLFVLLGFSDPLLDLISGELLILGYLLLASSSHM